jgi:type II secretory pathway component HofQ
MIVLGGLKKKETTRTKRKTFLLGDLPGIGELFTGKGKSEETTEMIVFIRPVLLQNNEAVREDTELYKANLTPKTRDEVNAYEETGRFSDKVEMDEDEKRKQRIKELKAERKAEAEEAREIRKEKRLQARAERAERRAREGNASKASRRAHPRRKTSVGQNAFTTSASKENRVHGKPVLRKGARTEKMSSKTTQKARIIKQRGHRRSHRVM